MVSFAIGRVVAGNINVFLIWVRLFVENWGVGWLPDLATICEILYPALRSGGRVPRVCRSVTLCKLPLDLVVGYGILHPYFQICRRSVESCTLTLDLVAGCHSHRQTAQQPLACGGCSVRKSNLTMNTYWFGRWK